MRGPVLAAQGAGRWGTGAGTPQLVGRAAPPEAPHAPPRPEWGERRGSRTRVDAAQGLSPAPGHLREPLPGQTGAAPRGCSAGLFCGERPPRRRGWTGRAERGRGCCAGNRGARSGAERSVSALGQRRRGRPLPGRPLPSPPLRLGFVTRPPSPLCPRRFGPRS